LPAVCYTVNNYQNLCRDFIGISQVYYQSKVIAQIFIRQMTDREFFLETLADEKPRFERALKAVPSDKLDYRPDDKSRTALELVKVFAVDSGTFEPFLKTGVVDFSQIQSPASDSVSEIMAMFLGQLDNTAQLISAMSEDDWASVAKMMMGEKEMWKTIKGKMAWGLLLDLIHHRGQLSVYLRPMGGKVPAIYGPSADTQD
jgi:uncharacterized damage-inducible protein DinB